MNRDKPDYPTAIDSACERCGNFAVLEVGGQTLCKDCIALAGGGCAGRGEMSDE